MLTVGALILAACQPQVVEVTRVVTETEVVTEMQEVEVTRVVDGEVVTGLQAQGDAITFVVLAGHAGGLAFKLVLGPTVVVLQDAGNFG